MRRFLRFFTQQPLLSTFFIVISTTLFLGDGKQSIIDIVSAGGVLALGIVAKFFSIKQRVLPQKVVIFVASFLLLLFLRTMFSDDIGYSIFISMRWVELFIVFFIFYIYSTRETLHAVPKILVGFSMFSLIASVAYTFTPELANSLPLTNSLTPVYGHNHIIDILLLGYPVSLWMFLKNPSLKKAMMVGAFLLGASFSFARAGVALIITVTILFMFFGWKKFSQKTKRLMVSLFVFLVAVNVTVFTVPKQDLRELSGVTQKTTTVGQGSIFEDVRMEYWRQAITAIKERPIFGSGPGTFVLLSKRFQSAPFSFSSYAHNSILEWIAEVGFLGVIFLIPFFIWLIHACKIFISKGGEVPALFISLLLIFIYSLIDFPLAFFVIQMLCILIMSLLSIQVFRSVPKEESRSSKNVLMGCLCAVAVLYCIQIACVISANGESSYTNCCLLSGNITSEKFNQISQKGLRLDEKVIRAASLFHSRNSSVQFAIGQILENYDVNTAIGFYMKAHEGYPKDAEIFNSLLDSLKRTNNTCQIDAELFSLEKSLFVSEQNVLEPYRDNVFETCHAFSPEDILQLDSFRNIEFDKQYMARVYYVWGKRFLFNERYHDDVIYFWDKARRSDPDLSFFSVELASFYEYVGNQEKAKEVLEECKKNKSAKNHCQLVEKEGITNIVPGSLSNQILQWKIK